MDWWRVVVTGAAAEGGTGWVQPLLVGMAIALVSPAVALVSVWLGHRFAKQSFDRQAEQDDRIRAEERGRADARRAEDRRREDAQRWDSERIAAIEQLGHETVDVRLGALFSLERLTVAEPEWFAANVYEILVAYLREHTRPERYDLAEGERVSIEAGEKPIPHVGTDIEAVLTILGRRRALFDISVDHLHEDDHGDGPHLVGVDLSGRWLGGVRFEAAILTDCLLEEATLVDCVFEAAALANCRFIGPSRTSTSARRPLPTAVFTG
jgi:hypothetical protein